MLLREEPVAAVVRRNAQERVFENQAEARSVHGCEDGRVLFVQLQADEQSAVLRRDA